ncbi:MAG: hypothetical protein MI867_18880 [Pseudomonadales bacterium]|nr:hypothetical protein [Pseudomonadales bacterium]
MSEKTEASETSPSLSDAEKKTLIPKPVKYFLLGWTSVIAMLALAAYIVDVMNQ